MGTSSGQAGADAAELGGKGAGLAALDRLGLPVPAWVPVGAAACDRVLARARPEIEAALAALGRGAFDRGACEEAAARIRAAVRTAGLDPADAAALREALERRLPGERWLAVRSSAVGEDGGADSFAGQLQSFLAVPRAEVEARVLDALASAFGARVLRYRRARALPPGAVRAAVIVQRLVPARRSGVLFTADPAAGDAGEAVLVAGLGLGEGVVSGQVETDLVRADLATGRVLLRQTAAKRARLAAAPEGGTLRQEVPEAEAAGEALSDAEVEALVGMGRRVAEAAGRPQDLEWAIDGDGAIHLLQARPVTAMATGREHVFDNANIVESYPGLTSPLTFSFIRPAYETTFLAAARAFGVPEAVLRRERETFANLVALIDGRVYYDLLGWYRLYQLVPGFEGLLPAFEKGLGIPRRHVRPAPPARGLGRLTRRLLQLRVVLRMARLLLGLPRQAADFLARLEVERAAHARLDLGTLEPHALLESNEHLAARLNAPYAVTAVNDLFTFQLHGLLERLLGRWRLGDPGPLRDALLTGIRGVESVEPARSVARLAGLVRTEPWLRSLFTSARSDAEVWSALGLAPQAAALRSGIEAHLAAHGDRTLQELKLETRPLAEDPALLVAMIRNALFAAEGGAPGEGAGRGDEARREVLAGLRRHPLRRALFRLVLDWCRDGLRRRESLRLARARALGMVRANYRALGRCLVRERLLDDPDDLFWLGADEVAGTVRGHALDRDLRALVALRRREWAEAAQRRPAPRIVTRGTVLAHRFEEAAPTSGSRPERLDGIGCCPGLVRGPARVVQDPSSDLAVRGHVLVAPTTDPGWIFLMVSAAALVVERGNPLSHTAIIGRELGLPTVVGVKGATALVRDGDLLEVDGSAGTVRWA